MLQRQHISRGIVVVILLIERSQCGGVVLIRYSVFTGSEAATTWIVSPGPWRRNIAALAAASGEQAIDRIVTETPDEGVSLDQKLRQSCILDQGRVRIVEHAATGSAIEDLQNISRQI